MILIAGVGNIFLGDDAFGSAVASRMAQRTLPENVRAVDFGIRGLDLFYALLEDYEFVVIVDAASRGQAPGTIYVIDPELADIDPQENPFETHSMDPVRVMAAAKNMGAKPKRIRIVGCEPESFGPPEEGRMGLSACVEAAVDDAIRIVESLIQEAIV